MTQTLVIAGAKGVVGRHLIDQALQAGYTIRLLTRRLDGSEASSSIQSFQWNPQKAAQGDAVQLSSLQNALEGTHALVNLAGASLAEGRLGHKHKQRVLNSRLDATKALVLAYQKCQNPPPCWVQASATGAYGETGETEVDESHPYGHNFLAEVADKWEAEATQIGQTHPSTRLMIARIGLVLARDAPAWKKMLLPIRLGVGGPLGSGRQWYSWIDADDLAKAFLFLINQPQAQGIYNLVAPQPIRQKELTQKTAQKIKRPAFMPAPQWALQLVLGEVADLLLLASCKAYPTRLLQEGFEFDYQNIDDELKKLLTKP